MFAFWVAANAVAMLTGVALLMSSFRASDEPNESSHD